MTGAQRTPTTRTTPTTPATPATPTGTAVTTGRRLTGSDLLATAATAGAVAGYLLHRAGSSTWPVDSVRGTVVLVLLLGAVGCATSRADALFLDGAGRSHAGYTALTSLLGLTALVAGGVALITTAEAALTVLTAAVAALWLAASLRHLLVPAPSTPGGAAQRVTTLH